MIEPYETPPNLDIAYILVGKSVVPRRVARPFMQFEIPRKWPQHRADRNGKESFDDGCLVFSSQVADRFEGEIERGIARAVLGVVLQLQKKRWNEIERLMNFRKLFGQRRHSEVVLRSVQVSPRHNVALAYQVFVKRLVHVPEK